MIPTRIDSPPGAGAAPTSSVPASAASVTAAVHARRVGVASAIWAGSILLSRVIGLVREGVLGRTLGAEAKGDLYATAFVVPDFLNYLLAGGALSIVFIPIFGAYLARGEEERASIAFSVVANFLCALLIVATVALWFAMPVLAPIAAPGFTPEQLRELVTLSRIVLPAQVFHVVGGLLSASMQARDRHALPALAPLVYTLGIIVGGLLGGAEHGAYGFAWGALVGSILGPFALPLIGALRSGLRWRPVVSWRHPDLRTYLVRSLPIMLGFSIVVVDDWYLKREGTILGPGAAAVLSYSKTLMKVPMGVFGLAAGVAVFPTLQRLVAEGKPHEMRALLVRTLKSLLVVSCLAQVVLSVCGEDLVAVVYGRTRLTPEQVSDIGTCLTLVSVGLTAWAAQTLIARGFYALGNTWMPALLGTVVAVASYPLYVAARSTSGLFGLALASSAAILIYAVALGVFLRRALRRAELAAPADGVVRSEPDVAARDVHLLRGDGFGTFLARAAIVTVASIGVGVLVDRCLPTPTTTLASAGHGAIAGGAALITFFVGAHVLGLDEVQGWIRALTRRLRRRDA